MMRAQVGGPGAAIFDFGVQGPCFGADGLKIPLGLAPSMVLSIRDGLSLVSSVRVVIER